MTDSVAATELTRVLRPTALSIHGLILMLCGAVWALAVCGASGLHGFLQRVDERYAHRVAVDEPSSCVLAATRLDFHEFEQYERVLVASACDPATVPGLLRVPRDGEVFLSPALDRLRNNDPAIQLMFPVVSGTIGKAGLTDAGEFRAIVGVPTSTPGLRPVAFGTPPADAGYVSGYLRLSPRFLLVVLLLAGVVPTVLLTAASVRLRHRSLQRRLRILHALGTRSSTLRHATMVATARLVALGAAVGSVASGLLLARATPTFATWQAHRGDMSPAVWAHLAAVATAPAVAAVGVAAAALRVSRRVLHARSLLRWAPLGLGWLGALLTALAGGGPAAPIGLAATIIGVAVVVPAVCSATGLLLLRLRPGPSLIAGHRLRLPSGALVRALAALSVGLVALGCARGVVQSNEADPRQTLDSFESDGLAVLSIRDAPDAQLPASTVASLVSTPTGNSESRRVSGECADFATIAGATFECLRDRTYFAFAYDVDISPGGPPDGAIQIRINPARGEVLGGSVFKPGADASAVNDHRATLLVAVPRADAAVAVAELIGESPGARVDRVGMSSSGGDAEMRNLLDVFRWAAWYAVMCALVGCLIAVAGLLGDRRAANAMLHVVGARTSSIGASLITEVLAAGAACIAWAWASGAIWTISLTDPSDNPVPLLGTLLAPMTALATLAVTTAAIAAGASKAVSRELLPSRGELSALGDVIGR
jgi:hypothetical protein